MTTLNIGVVGYSGQKFDENAARSALNDLLDQASDGRNDVTIVSGLNDLGIPALAYRAAHQRGWGTSGVACSKATHYNCYPVDKKVIVGDNWGDESQTFLDTCDVLVRVGGGKQSLREVNEFRARGGRVFEFDLAAQPS